MLFKNPNFTTYNITLMSNNVIINWNQYFFSSIAILGTITSSMNFIVFYNQKFADQIYKYFLFTSANDFMYCFILSFYALVTCGTICDKLRSKTFSAQFYLLFFGDYFTSSLALIGIIIEIFVSLQRLFLILNKNLMQNLKPTFVISIISGFCLIFYIPVLFVQEIVPVDNNKFELVVSQFGSTYMGALIPSIISSVRLLLASCVLFLINIITLGYFKKFLNKKKKIKKHAQSISMLISLNIASNVNGGCFVSEKKQEAKKSITLMVVLASLNYTIGTIPWATYFSIRVLFQ
ncbi:hypothetical protein BpHYR1_006321 [Brachionus plicatilis]|uniref:Uncharacterized protein n=1 Tax=Brachionus plicatilis TaxID=10195 RepID=A0A3M7QIR2_BRAPC|nr:hypothetical protein BpHYR1_006321 [Brachionus plicatilis]